MNKSKLIKCPKCQVINCLFTPYFWCYRNCRYENKEDISYQVNEYEQKQRKIVKEIIEFLFTNNIPLIEFPNVNLYDGNPDWGWVDVEINTIFLPRKTFYLQNDELVDTAVHEASHLLSEIRHNRVWYLFYLQQRERVFKEFAEFVSSHNPQVRFEKGYKIYPDSDKN